MPKITNNQIIFLIITVLFFCVYTFLVEPTIKEKYLDSDLSNFKNGSWKYTVILFIILLIIYLLLIIKSKIKDLSSLPIHILLLGLICFISFHSLTDKFLLYVNAQTEKEKVVRVYEIINHKKQQTFWLNNKNSIHSDKEISKINSWRTKKNLKSVFELKTNDTIIVTFKKGIMDVDYLY